MRLKYLGLVMVIIAAFLAGTLVPSALTQSGSSPQYVHINFMKVDPAKATSYVQMEREVWKPIHQERVKDGRMKSWSLYEVRFPGGENREYGYVTFETYDKIQDIEGSYGDQAAMGSLLKKVHPDKTVADLLSQAQSNRKMALSEVWRLVDRTN
jgi:hypothetical protein